jgi:hypothetical protein
MFNGCDYTVNVVVCAIQPNEYTGAMNITDSFNCEALNRGGGGLWTPSAKSVIVGMNARSAKGGLAYFACKAPSTPADTTYVEGAGINARCR